jgi:hypothetical protein
MDEDEMEEILYRLDERTKRVDDKLNRLDRETTKNSKDIDELQDVTRRNATVLGGVATAVSGVAIWFSDKLSRVI